MQKNSNFENFESATYSTSGSMPLIQEVEMLNCNQNQQFVALQVSDFKPIFQGFPT